MELIARLCVIAVFISFSVAQLTSMEKALLSSKLLRMLDSKVTERQSMNNFDDEEESGKRSVKWDNDLGHPLKVECDTEKGEALVQMKSKYNKKEGDRQFKWECRQATEDKVLLTDCEWSKEVNKWNGPISYICPTNKIMAGIRSKNHKSKNDRKWKVKCCKADGHITMSCGISKKLNSYHGNVDYETSHDGSKSSVFVGIQSLENQRNDREWRMFECDFGTPKCTPKAPSWPSTYPRDPSPPLSNNHSPYSIVLDLNKMSSPNTPPSPKSHSYTVHAPPAENDGPYTIELSPMQANEVVNGMTHLVQRDESLISHKKTKPTRLLPVPPGTSKHPDIPKKNHDKTSPTNFIPNNGHIIEIVPKFDSSHPTRKNPSYSLQYKRPQPNQSQERHIHIYPPPGNSPGLFTVYPHPNSGAPKVRFTEPPTPPQKTHYHVQLPPGKKAPSDLHYEVPIPHKGDGMRYKAPLSTPNSKKPKVNTIEKLLKELASHKMID